MMIHMTCIKVLIFNCNTYKNNNQTRIAPFETAVLRLNAGAFRDNRDLASRPLRPSKPWSVTRVALFHIALPYLTDFFMTPFSPPVR